MKMQKITTVLSVLTLAAMFGCSSGQDGTVLARVNRAKITTADFKRQIEDLQPQMQQAVASDPKARKEFLDDLIGIEVVLQEARRQGLDKDPEFKKRQDLLKKEMERRIQEDSRNELFNGLLKKELADKLSKVSAPTDQEVKDYYAKNIDKMKTMDGRRLSFKEVEPQLKRRIMAEKQRDLYLEYAKGLKEKAKITVDDKALDAAATSLQQAPAAGLTDLPSSTAGKTDAKRK